MIQKDRKSRLGTLAATAAAMLALAAPAAADFCRTIEAELSSISRGPSVRERQIAGRAAAEAHRLHAHMRSIGCDRQQFLMFGQPPPPECGAYRARYAELVARSRPAYGPDEGRRQQLMSALITYGCRTSPLPRERSSPLTAGIFDDSPHPPGELGTDDLDYTPIIGRVRLPSGKPICVRMCDGYYFPAPQQQPGTSPEDAEQACQALCPASETKIFFQSRAIEDARGLDGRTYGETDNAFRYRRSYDAGCGCQRAADGATPGQMSPMNPSQSGSPFDVLNPLPPDEEEAPLRDVTPTPGRKRDDSLFGGRPPPAPPAPPHPPLEVPADRIVSGTEGEIREIRGKDGVTRTVRVIAPELSPDPSKAKAPAVPGRAPAP